MHGEPFKLQDFFLGGQHEDVSWLKDECCALQRFLITNLSIVCTSKKLNYKL